MTSPRGLWKDRAILREAGGILQPEWYVRFGRRQRLTDWLNEHTREQVFEMYGTTALHEDIPLRILDLFPIVEPVKLLVGHVYFPNDLQESDVEQLRGFLDHQATARGLQVEPESVELHADFDLAIGLRLHFTAIAR